MNGWVVCAVTSETEYTFVYGKTPNGITAWHMFDESAQLSFGKVNLYKTEAAAKKKAVELVLQGIPPNEELFAVEVRDGVVRSRGEGRQDRVRGGKAGPEG